MPIIFGKFAKVRLDSLVDISISGVSTCVLILIAYAQGPLLNAHSDISIGA